MSRRHPLRLTLVGSALALAAGALAVGPSYAADNAQIYLVQGLPNELVDVKIDGKAVDSNIKTDAIAGPFTVHAGKHAVTVSSRGKVITQGMVSVGPNTSIDVVAHLPAPSKSKPVLTAYKNDLGAVPKDKAALTVAHTAKVPPADIRVNGKVLFENVANGESLNLVVPVATYSVDIVPTGKKSPVFLGPLNLTVKGGALNRVYAVGDPKSSSMNVAVHIVSVSNSGSDKPNKVNTGSGGQAVGADSGLQVNLVR